MVGRLSRDIMVKSYGNGNDVVVVTSAGMSTAGATRTFGKLNLGRITKSEIMSLFHPKVDQHLIDLFVVI